jgi:hypothetical protein
MKNLIKSIVVFAIAYFALKYLLWVGIGYALVTCLFRAKEENEPAFSDYLWRLATSIDQTLNACLPFILNDLMRYPNGTNYGNIDETISGVTGKNQLSNSLTWFGKSVNWFLSKLEKDHSIKSIESDE